ncbi:hypothetical protein PHYSODRAFT_413109, partial [Phytophthora sojae]
KRRQYLCKVGSVFSVGKGCEITFTCPTCSAKFNRRVALCNTVRRLAAGNTLTCSQIWHASWKNGTQLLRDVSKRIRFRNGKR